MTAYPGIALILVVAMGLVACYTIIHMPGRSYTGELPALTGRQKEIEARLRVHVRKLADEIGERHFQASPALNAAAEYIELQFEQMGYTPRSEYFHDDQFRNIVVNRHGNQKREEIIVVAAHYDTWKTPGADDNASGVAGLLEIARVLKDREINRTIRFIALANEEKPFFGTDAMGSRVSARRSRENRENITGMFSLEMIGYYSYARNSQRYPGLIRYFYPDRGNFIAFAGNMRSGNFLKTALRYFREEARFPSEGLAAPEWLAPDIRRSDNSSYWDYGFPAVMVTDTSNFRNEHYHQAGDTADTLDYDSMARVVDGLARMLLRLAE